MIPEAEGMGIALLVYVQLIRLAVFMCLGAVVGWYVGSTPAQRRGWLEEWWTWP